MRSVQGLEHVNTPPEGDPQTFRRGGSGGDGEERESAWRAAELGSINDGKSLTPEIDGPIVKAGDKIADH